MSGPSTVSDPEPDRLSRGHYRWGVLEQPWHPVDTSFYEGLYYGPGNVARYLGDRTVLKA